MEMIYYSSSYEVMTFCWWDLFFCVWHISWYILYVDIEKKGCNITVLVHFFVYFLFMWSCFIYLITYLLIYYVFISSQSEETIHRYLALVYWLTASDSSIFHHPFFPAVKHTVKQLLSLRISSLNPLTPRPNL